MVKDRIDAFFHGREAEIADAVATLVAIKSIREAPLPGMPFGSGPAEALDVALRMAQSMGLRARNMDNYVGIVDINERENALGILAHLDVVGEGSGWSTPPYRATLKNGMLYGRGTSDDKGPAVAALFALKAVKELGIPLSHGTRLILGTDEESGCEDIAYYGGRESFPPMSFSPDGSFPVTNTEKGGLRPLLEARWEESSALPRVRSVKGGFRINVVPSEADAALEGLDLPAVRAACEAAVTGAAYTVSEGAGTIHVHCTGEGGHAAEPEKANNALTALLAALARLPFAPSEGSRALRGLASLFPHGDYLGEAAGIAMSDPVAGPLTLTFSLLDYGLTGLSGRFDSRTPLCATTENTIDVISPKLQAAGITMGTSGLGAPHHTPCDSRFVKTLLAAYERYTGRAGSCMASGGGTYVHGIDGGVCFGAAMPGFEPNVHGPDEHMSVADLLTSAKIFAHVIVDLCS